MTQTVLLVEDSPADALLLRHRFKETTAGERWRVQHVGALQPALDRLSKGDIDVVLLDLGLPDSVGLATLERLREREPRVPVVVLTGTADDATGIRALELGAQDYLVKGETSSTSALRRSIRYSIERSRMAELQDGLAARVAEAQNMESLGVLAAGAGHAYNILLGRILEDVDACIDSPELRAGGTLACRLSAIRRAVLEGEAVGERLRSYAAQGRTERRSTDLSAFVVTCSDLLDPLVPAPAELDFDLAEELQRVWIDPVQLRQLLVALVLNSVNAIGREQRGRVLVRTGVVRADRELLARTHGGDALDPGTYVELRVQDDGRGIAPDVKERIFDPFFTTRYAGHGLGLSAALGIARQHGGAISVESAEPKGTAVCVLFPPCGDAE